MAQLILDWLNEEVRLSRRVFSLEHDFKDGYLLGELLHKYNQQSNFDKFSMKGNPNAKITNFCLLEPSMRQIGVNFNAKIAFDVMHATNGTAKDLVYDMRATLEGIRKRSSRSALVNNEKSLSSSAKILTVLRHGTPLFDKTMMTTFENSVRAMMENPNDVLMEQITRKFDQKKMDFRQTVNSSHSRGMDTMELELTKRRDLQKHSKTHGKEFTSALNLINEDQWGKNQRIAHERREREERFDKTAAQRRDFMRTTATNAVRDSVLSGIDEFEARLESDLFTDDTSLKKTVGQALKKMMIEEPGAKLIDTTFLDKAVLQSGLLLSKKTLKEKNEDKITKDNLKDRRRRRFLGEREISHRASLKQAAASEIIEQLLNPSQSEIFEAQYLSRVVLQKDLITENRMNRDQLVANLNDAEAHRTDLWRQEEAAREIEWVIAHKILSQNEKLKALEEARYAADRERDLVVSSAALMMMQRISEWVESCNKMGLFESTDAPSEFTIRDNHDSIPFGVPVGVSQRSLETLETVDESPSIFWSDARLMLTSGIDVTKALPAVHQKKIFKELPHSLSEQLSYVDSKWLLAKPFRTHNVMPALDPLSFVTAENSMVEDESIVMAFESPDESEKKHKGVKFTEQGEEANQPAMQEDSVTLSASLPEGAVAYPNPVNDDRWAEDPVREISEYLAVCDYNKFMYETANVEISGYDIAPVIPVVEAVIAAPEKGKGKAAVVVEVEEVPSDPNIMVHAPVWLLSTPSKYLLGEVIVALRCAAEAGDIAGPEGDVQVVEDPQTPMPASMRPSFSAALEEAVEAADVVVAAEVNIDILDVPADVTTGEEVEAQKELLFIEDNNVNELPAFSVRLALCGVSELARKSVSDAVSAQSEGSVRIIRVDQLLSEAISLGSRLKVESDAGVESSNEGCLEGIDGVMERGERGERENRVEESELCDLEGIDRVLEVKGKDCDRHQLALLSLSIVLAGESIPDDVYVALVIQAIQDLGAEQQQQQQQQQAELIEMDTAHTEEEGKGEGGEAESKEFLPLAPALYEIKGFIIEDFPTTKNQALQLVAALSGINYEDKMPQVTDMASPFAPLAPYTDVTYDIALCGLDTVLFLESSPLGIQTTLSEIFSARTNLDTNEVTYLQAGTDMLVDNLEELRGLVSCPHTAVIDIALTTTGADDLQAFLSKIGVLKIFDMSAFGSLGEAAGVAAGMICPTPYQASGESENIIDNVDNRDGGIEGDVARSEGPIMPFKGDEQSRNPPVEQALVNPEPGTIGEGAVSLPQTPHTPLPPVFTQMPRELAKALSDMWRTAESQSVETGRSFFNTLRDSRYQMVQRRRALHDALSVLHARLDNRQEIFDDFVSGFNAIDDDFRFDNECAAELHLRSLELREVLLGGCDTRKKDAELFVARAAVDGIAGLLVHLSECEGAAMLQAEYNRFVISLHLLFDYTKTMASYDRSRKTFNLLEETLAPPDDTVPSAPSGSAKVERKASTVGMKKPAPMNRKGSSAFVTETFPDPFRIPVPPVSLPLGSMNEIPRQTIIVDHNDEEKTPVSGKVVKGKEVSPSSCPNT